MAQFAQLYARICCGEITQFYVDNSHFHQDLDIGYTWAPAGHPAWRASTSPPLAALSNCYVAYDFTQGQALRWQKSKCNIE